MARERKGSNEKPKKEQPMKNGSKGSSPSQGKKPVLHKKEQPSTYEKLLKVDMTFDELLEAAVSVPPPTGNVPERKGPDKGKSGLIRKEARD